MAKKLSLNIPKNIADKIPYQFCVRNRSVDTQDYLKDILVLEQFKKLDGIIKEQFSKLYGYVAKHMSLKDRLESLFDIYHPEQKDSFGKIVDYDGNGFSFHSMQLMKLTTKDLIASIDYNDLVMIMYIVLVVMSLVLFLKIQLKSFVKH